MELSDVMHQAIARFAPLAKHQEEAIQAAIAAGERLIVGLGLGFGLTSKEELRGAAIEVWNLYVQSVEKHNQDKENQCIPKKP